MGPAATAAAHAVIEDLANDVALVNQEYWNARDCLLVRPRRGSMMRAGAQPLSEKEYQRAAGVAGAAVGGGGGGGDGGGGGGGGGGAAEGVVGDAAGGGGVADLPQVVGSCSLCSSLIDEIR